MAASDALKRKVGPLPVWGWMAAVGLGVLLYYRRQQANAAQSSTGGTVYDPNAVDPASGLTYGQESQLALGYGGGALTPTTGASTDTGGQPAWTDIIGGWQGIAQAWQDIASSGLTGAPGPAGPAGAPGSPPTPAPGATKTTTPNLRGKGAVLGPRQPKKPKAPAGYKAVGLGHGFWEFVPVKPAKSTGAKSSSTHRAPAHSNENTNHQAASHTTPPPASTRVQIRNEQAHHTPPPPPHVQNRTTPPAHRYRPPPQSHHNRRN